MREQAGWSGWRQVSWVVAEGEQQEVKGRFKDGGETCCDAWRRRRPS